MPSKLFVFLLILMTGLSATASDDALDIVVPDGLRDNANAPVPLPWVEESVAVPPMPAREAWEEVELGNLQHGARLYIAPDAVEVGEQDRVTRLWVFVESRRGKVNGTYEGINCSSGEFKPYAYGSPARGKIREARLDTWRPVVASHRLELMKSVLCNLRAPRHTAAIRDAMRGGVEPSIDFLINN